ncbi:recombinase family protein [Endozoicomonas acroporae]|uniref:recombinase family protein n=1 Tax=Endozoicomonas acroporae TaxID=1701104 RepID=UPI000C78B45E|nr:recombinase family protein [Endozoicomonas acroporae]
MTIIKTMDSTITRTTYCYSYHRISTRNQLKGGGIKRQIEDSSRFCEAQNWVMDTTFKLTDIGTSAYHGKNLDDRAALGSFLKAADDGLVKRPAVLLVESLDRLSRANIMDALELFIRILNAGISICTYHDRMIYSKESIQANFGPLLISITIMCRAHEESETKSKRVKRSWIQMREKIRNGGIGSKKIYPKWISTESGRPEIIESEAKIIREIFDLCVNHNMSYTDIIVEMRKRHNNNINLRSYQLNRLFRHKNVLGIYCTTGAQAGEEIKAYPAIISEDMYYKAKALIKERISVRVGQPTKYEINFFKTKLSCGDCGYAITSNRANRSTSYLCREKLKTKTACKQSSKITAKKFQPVLLYAISLIDKDDMLESAANSKKAKLSKAINTKQAELEDKQTRMDNLADLVAAGSKKGVQMVVQLEGEVDTILQDIATMQDQLDMLNSPTMAASIDHANEFGRKFILGQATKEDQEPFVQALGNIVEKIVIHSPEKEGQRTIAIIKLLSGIDIRVVVEKDYSADIFKGKKRIGRFTPKG